MKIKYHCPVCEEITSVNVELKDPEIIYKEDEMLKSTDWLKQEPIDCECGEEIQLTIEQLRGQS